MEKGFDLPADTISIVFETINFNQLVDFLDILPVKKEGLKNAIVGKKGDKYEIVSFEKILYFEAEGNDVYYSKFVLDYIWSDMIFVIPMGLFVVFIWNKYYKHINNKLEKRKLEQIEFNRLNKS